MLRNLSKNPAYGVENNEYDRTLWFEKGDHRLNVLIVGNSHSKDLYNVLIHSVDANSYFQIARFGAQISDLKDFFSTSNYIAADVILFVSRYKKNDLNVLEKVIQKVLNDGKKVAIVKNIFEFSYYSHKNYADYILQQGLIKQYLSGDSAASMIVDKIDKAYYDKFTTRSRRSLLKESDDIIEAIAEKYNEIIVLDRMDYICDMRSSKCFAISNNFEKYFYDYGHHTLAGASFFGRRIDEVGWLHDLIKIASKNTR